MRTTASPSAGHLSIHGARMCVAIGFWLAAASTAFAQTRPDVLWETLGHASSVHAVAFSGNGSWVASGSEDSSMRVWKLDNGTPVADTTHCCGVYDLDFSPDSSRVVAATTSDLQVFQSATAALLRDWNTGQPFPSVAYSPDGTMLASSSESSGVKVWDADTGGLIQTLAAAGPCRDVKFSPDGALLASASDGDVRIWNTSDWSFVRTLAGTGDILESLQFSRDGERIVAANDQVLLWRVGDGVLEHTYSALSAGVRSAALSPDGKFIVGNAPFADEILFWDVDSESIVDTFTDSTGLLVKIKFSPTGRLYAYGQVDGNVIVAKNPYWPKGDMDGDGLVDTTDQKLFTRTLLAAEPVPELKVCADLNDDGRVNGLDVAAFVEAQLGG